MVLCGLELLQESGYHEREDRFPKGGGMKLRVIDGSFSICQVEEVSTGLLGSPFCFIGKTDEELSLVCPTGDVPADTLARDDGWRMFGVVGAMEFSLVGVLASLSKALADAGVGIFAVSTYNTDYILVKAEQLLRAIEALRQAGYDVVQ